MDRRDQQERQGAAEAVFALFQSFAGAGGKIAVYGGNIPAFTGGGKGFRVEVKQDRGYRAAAGDYRGAG